MSMCLQKWFESDQHTRKHASTDRRLPGNSLLLATSEYQVAHRLAWFVPGAFIHTARRQWDPRG